MTRQQSRPGLVEETRPAGDGKTPGSDSILTVSLPKFGPIDLEHFAGRILQDALTKATAGYWLRRADQFAAVGNPDCDEIATACRNHARLVDGGLDEPWPGFHDDLDQVLEEVA